MRNSLGIGVFLVVSMLAVIIVIMAAFPDKDKKAPVSPGPQPSPAATETPSRPADDRQTGADVTDTSGLPSQPSAEPSAPSPTRREEGIPVAIEPEPLESGKRGPIAEPLPVQPPRPPVPETAPAGGRTYAVQQGENLYVIAKKVYGDAELYREIEKANPGIKPLDLKVGQKIVLPRVEKPAPAPKGVKAQPAAEPSGKAPSYGVSAEGKRTYTIRKGDNLYDIAKREYGNGSLCREIEQANPGIKPMDLKVGTVIILPDLPRAKKKAPAAKAPE